jgi:HK97 family phage major capsid protein
MELEQKLTTLQSELKTYFDKAAEEQKTRGSMLEETKTSIMNLQKQVDAIDLKLNERHAQSEPFTDPVEVAMKESESLQRMFKDKRGNAVIHIKGTLDRMQRKTVITENVTGSIGTETGAGVGFATTGVLPIDRIPGITPEARYQLRVRNVLFSRPTTAAVIDFVKVSTPMSIASPVAEGSVKPQNAVAFTAASEKVRTIATWIPATRQVLDDFTELRAYIDGALRYAVDKDEEIELLSGDSTGEHLHGLIPQATAFSTSLLTASAGYQRLDLIATAIGQIASAAETDPTFVVLNTTDWWKLRLTKDSQGRYILGDPQGGATNPQIWGLNLVPSNSIAAGTFLVGSGSPAAAEIRDRMDTVVEVSTEHSDYFVRNMVAIRCEKRVALIVKRPASFITGTFTTSP